jgi:hypothetical protein
MNIISTLSAALLLASSVFAGGATIDSTDYLPLGHFHAWEMIDSDNFVTGGTQIVSVKKTITDNEQLRYNVRTKVFDEIADVVFQLGIEGENAYLYGARVVVGDVDFGDSDIKVDTMLFEPKVFLGSTTTTLDTDPVVTDVTSSIKFKIKIGPKSFGGKVDVAGTIATSWQSVGDVDTPLGLIPGSDLAQLTMTFDFTYSSQDEDIHEAIEDESTLKTVHATLGANRGFVQIDGAGSSAKVLKRAILTNTTLGNFPPLTSDLSQLTIPTPQLFNLFLDDSGESGLTDEFLSMTDLELTQRLGGKTELTANIDVNGGVTVPVQLKGKTKFKKDGSALISLKGKTPHPELFAPLKMKIKSVITADSTELLLTYKGGKDPFGSPILGEVMIPIAPAPVASVELALNKLLDVKFDPNPLKRKLGAEGTLTVGTKIIPVTVFESLKAKPGSPVTRNYSLIQSGGSGKKLLKFRASNTDESDYLVSKMRGSLVGLKVQPDVTTLDITMDAED